jgi:metal-responsive CopG/Arc/MetJ family transcriptional regulator
MEEKRSAKISIMLPPSLVARLDAYARKSRWSRSNAVAVLVEEGLDAQEDPGRTEP